MIDLDLETKITAGQRGSVPVLKHAQASSLPYPLFDSFRYGNFCLDLLYRLVTVINIGLDESVEHLIGKVTPKPVFRPVQVSVQGVRTG